MPQRDVVRPHHHLRTACALAVALAVAAGAARAQDEALAAAGPPRLQGKPVRSVAAPSTRLAIAGALGRVPQVALPALDVEPFRVEDEILAGTTKAMRIGVPRPVSLRGGDGSWHELENGAALWALDVVSPGAVALRLHLADLRLPAGAELAVYAPPDAGLDVGNVELLRAGAGPRASHWTATTAGERARLELYLPGGRGRLPFRVDSLQHIYRHPLASDASLLAKAAGPCHNDATCFGAYANLVRATGMLSFVGSGGAGFCTGTLLNISNKTPDFTPYFLTANHCLSSADDAASIEILWNYETTSCGGPAQSLSNVRRSVGATLVSTGEPSDFTLLIVEGRVPLDVIWAGWTSKPIRPGQPAVGVHHPDGDFKRISFGVTGAGRCPGGSNEVQVDWYDGVTEPGSSGSGIFTDDSRQQLFGQLWHGPSSCSASPGNLLDCYGSFANSYRTLKTPLKGGPDDNLDQNDSCKKAKRVRPGFFPGRVVKLTDEDWYRVDVPAGRTVVVQLDFAHGNGDVDLEGYAACGGAPIAVSNGVLDGEGVALTNVGSRTAQARFRVFLADDTRANYDLAIGLE
jgi:hypothetical protein